MKRSISDMASGVLLIFIGLVLFLRVVGVAPQTMETLAWMLGSVLAGLQAALGFIRHSTAKKFWGSLGCVAAAHLAVWTSGLMEPTIEETMGAGLLWVGLAFTFVWLSAPHKLDLLVPAILFSGPGVGYYLWWYDLVRLESLKQLFDSGWPVLVVLLGAGILLRSLIPIRQ